MLSYRQDRNVPRAAGFTLLEVMIAVFVLSVGLLGLALLQTTGLRLNTDSYSRTQATYAAYDIIDRMRASVKGLSSNADVTAALANYEVPSTAAAATAVSNYESCKASTCNCSSSACNAAQLATFDLGQWYNQQDRLVPGAKDAGRGLIDVNNNLVTITMSWMEQDDEGAVKKQQAWSVEIYR